MSAAAEKQRWCYKGLHECANASLYDGGARAF